MEKKHEQKTVDQLLELKKNKMLSSNLEYQRGQVWSKSQKKRLVDSVMRGYPIPLIYLHHIKKEVAGHHREDFEVIDGQQRLDALYEFREGAFKLFDPVKDEAEARFPSFIKKMPCDWGGLRFEELSTDLQRELLETELSIVMIQTNEPNEARDLFIRLQAGMPLNAQEKRDAWPGNFTEYVLKVGGKPEIARYPGHEFFTRILGAKAGSGRGKFRQLAAQLIMLYLRRRETGLLCDINRKSIDNFYYQHLSFDLESAEARRFQEILTMLTDLFSGKGGKRILGHEAIHLILLVDTLLDDYTRSWIKTFVIAFDIFRTRLAQAKLTAKEGTPEKHWLRYGSLTRVNSDRADTIQRRHQFFCEEMMPLLKLQMKDPTRMYGSFERDIIYHLDRRTCQVCDTEVAWHDAEIHHIDGHAEGGATVIANGCLVHRACHPKGRIAVSMKETLKSKISSRR